MPKINILMTMKTVLINLQKIVMGSSFVTLICAMIYKATNDSIAKF